MERDPYDGAGRGFAWTGRSRELDLLLAALEIPPAVVTVEGEPGIGKSRLLQEAGRTLTGRGIRVVTGLCHPLREPLPFGPVLDALRGTADWLPEPDRLNPQTGALAPLLPALARRLPPPPARPEDPRTGRFQLMGAVRSLLDAVGPLVLAIEDLHWADEATRELLLLLARDLPKQLGLVLTYRREDLPADTPVLGAPYRRPPGTSGAEIHLDTLAEEEVHALAAAVLGPRANPALSRTLFERSAGLPLVVEEDLLTLTDRARDARRGSGRTPRKDALADDISVLTEAAVPRGLREAVTARMSALSEPATAVVEAAAVLAVPASRHLLTELTGLDPRQAGPALTEALRAAVLRETAPGHYGFRHALAQQAVYQDIPGPHRQDLHRLAVRVLWTTPQPPLVQIAHHTRALGDIPAWLRQAEAAADQATALGDEGTATTLLHEILAEPRLEPDLRTRSALALSRIAVNGVDYTTTTSTLRRILADPQLPTAARGEIRLALGLLMFNLARDAAAPTELERAVEELATRPELAARAMVALAMAHQRSSQAARAWMDRAEKTVRDSPDHAARAAVRATRLSLMASAGDRDVWGLVDALPLDDPDPEVLRQTSRALFNVGDTALGTGYDTRAAALIHESLDLARRLGTLVVVECLGALDLLRLDWLAGRWEHLEADHAALTAQYPDMAGAAFDAHLASGCLAAARGRWTRALDQLGQAAHIAEAATEAEWKLRATAVLVHVHLARGQAQAWTVTVPALAALRSAACWPVACDMVPVAVQAALAGGHHQDAHDLVTEAEHALEGVDAPAAHAETHLARGLVLQHDADSEGAAGHFDRARLTFQAIGRPHHTARALEHHARALAPTDPQTAADHLTEAAATHAALGATADAARCQQALRELGLHRPTPRGRRSYGEHLSPRETQVAQLLATGATNNDIAHALAISPRTVEQHVANTLKKLRTTRDNIPGPHTAPRAP
ncbi:LuxR family transcriptional regulator [Kitasatospora indigofera]|uniref:LuxR family transcriptional regulator n=1 Tax=Kitasatospora indigofera TaxID=67307 RepID=A0A919FNN0_9ACTN|nr:AAA family ATPase [Kitasatospora indigofera]GHH69108.1 LuxR family transcriptional regulator [Kitasatospora indigofera]